MRLMGINGVRACIVYHRASRGTQPEIQRHDPSNIDQLPGRALYCSVSEEVGRRRSCAIANSHAALAKQEVHVLKVTAA